MDPTALALFSCSGLDPNEQSFRFGTLEGPFKLLIIDQ
jgi:hypothetical protein